MPSNQEIFNTVAKHLLQQNKASSNNTGTCFYRGPNGLKCAIGALIPDNKYSPELECHSIHDLEVWDLMSNLGYKHEQLPLLSDLQGIHDGHFPADWKNLLTSLAKKYELSSEVLNETY